MNGSRSYNNRPGFGGESYDELNRTIEGLEARIEGLMDRERGGSGRDPYRQQPSRDQWDDPAHSIRERQRALENRRQAPHHDDYRERQPAPRPAEPGIDPGMLTALLSDLRRDLKSDISGSVSGEVAALRREMSELRSEASGRGMPDDLKRDLARISASIDGLGRSSSGADQLRLELDSMRGMIDRLAREDTLRHLESRWSAVENHMASFDTGALRDELVNLAYRVDDIREALATMPASEMVLGLEDKISGMSRMIESLARQPSASGPDLARQFDALGSRLDEISRAIVSMPAPVAPELDTAPFERLEARLAAVARKIESFDNNAASVDLGSRIEALSSRVSSLAGQEAVSRLDQRLEALQRLVQDKSRDVRPDEVSAHLNDLARKIDAIGNRDIAQPLASRLDDLARRIDKVATAPSPDALPPAVIGRLESLIGRAEQTMNRPQLPLPGLETLESRLNDIAARLDRKPEPTGPLQVAGLDALKGQLNEIASRMQTMPVSGSDPVRVEGLESLEARLNDIAAKLDRAPQMAGPVKVTGFENLETRLADLTSRLDTLPAPASGPVRVEGMETLEDRLKEIAARLDSVPHGESAGGPVYVPGIEALEQRIADLAHRLDAAPSNTWTAELENRLADIARRLDEKPQAMDLNYIDSRLTEISDRLDRQMDAPETSALEARMADLAARLDSFSSGVAVAGEASGTGDEALRNLEAQIANLSRLVSASPQAAPANNEGIEQRLASIEEHLQTSDEYVIEAARQAAEAAISAFSGQSANAASPQSIANIEIVSALADDLKALELLSHKSDDRTMRAFEAVQDTLLKIASRLEKLDVSASRVASPVSQYVPEPAMQHESMPDRPRSVAAAAAAAAAAALEPEPTAPSIMRYDDNSGPSDFDAGDDETDAFITSQTGKRGRVSPAEAAAMAAAFATSEEGRADLENEAASSGSKSLFGGLKSRLQGGKAPSRDIEPGLGDIGTPSIDPSLDLDPATANMPLEPGSGAPDINRILQKVREAQSSEKAKGNSGSSDKAEFLESARRAAMAAAEEVQIIGKGRKKDDGEAGSAIANVIKSRRRPIILAAGAVLLLVLSVQLVGNFLGGSEEVGEQTVIEGTANPVSGFEAPEEPDNAAAPGNEETSLSVVEPSEELVANAPEENGGLPEVRVIDTPDEEPVAAPVETAAPQNDDAINAELANLPDALAPAALKAAAQNGDALAFFEIGARFTEGRGTQVDLAQAANWYRRAADLGNAPAQYRLANFYEKGSGIDRDIDAARKWYQMAAEQGNASAMHNLAVLHATSGPAPDYERAFEWFKQAAEVGVRDSQVNLAILYARGDGVARDLAESYKWFAIAANDGDKDAAQKRDEVFNALRPEQAEAAREAVATFRPQPLDPEINQPSIPEEWGGAELKTASIDMTKAIRNIQAILNNNGFDAGAPDGVMGKKTVAAIKAFQESIGMEVDGEVSDKLVKELLARNR